MQQSIRDILGIKVIKFPSVPENRKHCRTCFLEIQGEGAKKKKNTLGKTVHYYENYLSPYYHRFQQKFSLVADEFMNF